MRSMLLEGAGRESVLPRCSSSAAAESWRFLPAHTDTFAHSGAHIHNTEMHFHRVLCV